MLCWRAESRSVVIGMCWLTRCRVKAFLSHFVHCCFSSPVMAVTATAGLPSCGARPLCSGVRARLDRTARSGGGCLSFLDQLSALLAVLASFRVSSVGAQFRCGRGACFWGRTVARPLYPDVGSSGDRTLFRIGIPQMCWRVPCDLPRWHAASSLS